MKKTDTKKYLFLGFIGLVVVGALVVVSQNSGQLFQGDLIRSTTTTLTLDSVNRDLQALKTKVASLESQVTTLNTASQLLLSHLFYSVLNQPGHLCAYFTPQANRTTCINAITKNIPNLN